MHHSLACNKESPILYYKKHDHPCPLYPCSTSTISMSRLAPPTGAPHFTCTTQTTQLKPCPPSPMQCWTALMLSCCALKPALGRSQLRLSVPWTASAAAQRWVSTQVMVCVCLCACVPINIFRCPSFKLIMQEKPHIKISQLQLKSVTAPKVFIFFDLCSCQVTQHLTKR